MDYFTTSSTQLLKIKVLNWLIMESAKISVFNVISNWKLLSESIRECTDGGFLGIKRFLFNL